MGRKHKCDCPPAGAPEWALTYGDMMSLLLTFFILLVSISEIKDIEKYQAIVMEIKESFGMLGGNGLATIKDVPATSLIRRLEKVHTLNKTKTMHSDTEDPGVDGREPQVTRVREGMLFTQGGRITFEAGSARLDDTARRDLVRVGHLIRGYNNKIEVRGHAASMELNSGSSFTDLWSLSYARARAVMDLLTGPEVGIRQERIRLIACADTEPLVKRVYTATDQAPNRRAEILVMEALVEDFEKPEPVGPG